MSKQQEVALITGAARGIGLATAHTLSLRGAFVVLVDNDAAELKKASSRFSGELLA